MNAAALRHALALGDSVLFKRNPAFPRVKSDAWLDAQVRRVHHPHLVDLEVLDEDGSLQFVPLVPFLVDGEPDPNSPIGRCQLKEERAPWVAPEFPSLDATGK